MKDQLSRLEQQLQAMVEGSISRLFGGAISPATVASQLAAAMIDGLKWDAQAGKAYAPDQYAMTMHPKDVEAMIQQAPDVRADLGHGLLEAARTHGYVMSSEPNITLAADPTLGRWQFRVIAWHSGNPLEFTQGMPSGDNALAEAPPPGAFLIIEGRRHFPLDRTVINVGRRLDNQLILDDPHVSRTHAQLRAREGRFVLFDLGSTGGTLVNGRRIHQHVLRPGDVIRIAGTSIVYGEDPGGPPDQTPAYTPPFPPRPAGDQATRSWGAKDDDG
ncbi:MAG TPA: FhaA domain-containing protein [Anaerolineales bacterium]|nr:FhaA domain-containing protein [Anaerolineales bacterium]